MTNHDPGREWRGIVSEIVTRLGGQTRGNATGRTHARSSTDADTVSFLFIFASTPAMLVSAWGAGRYLVLQNPAGGRLQLLQEWGWLLSAGNWQSDFLLGVAYVVPLLLVAGLVSLFWAAIFARVRGRSIDPGWLTTAWIYVLLVPADLSLLLAGLGMSFAAVLGLHIFGGTGRYIVSPAILGALFIRFSYPGAGNVSSTTSWDNAASLIAGQQDTALLSIGDAVSAGGAVPMSLACLAGAALLARSGAASWRLLMGGVLGVVLAATLAGLLSELPVANLGWHWHVALGSLPICLAFVITDPTTSSLSKGGRWLHGLVFALIVVAIRVLDPTHPDGSLFAALLATLTVPLIDHIVVQRHVARAQGHLELRV